MVALQLQNKNLPGLLPAALMQNQSTPNPTPAQLVPTHQVAQSSTLAQLSLLSAADPRRTSLQNFIAQGFAAAYGANVQKFMPDLLAVSARGEWQAVLGIRSGQNQRLFVEQYLDADICTVLQSAGVQTKRDAVVEIGNLFSANRQYTLLLFVVLAYALHQLGYRQLVCCATEQVQALLSRHGLVLTYLADGDASRLGEAASQWGSYYQSHPKVCALDLTAAMTLIAESPRLLALPHQYWPALHATVTGLSLENHSYTTAADSSPLPDRCQSQHRPLVVTESKTQSLVQHGAYA